MGGVIAVEATIKLSIGELGVDATGAVKHGFFFGEGFGGGNERFIAFFGVSGEVIFELIASAGNSAR